MFSLQMKPGVTPRNIKCTPSGRHFVAAAESGGLAGGVGGQTGKA